MRVRSGLMGCVVFGEYRDWGRKERRLVQMKSWEALVHVEGSVMEKKEWTSKKQGCLPLSFCVHRTRKSL